MTLPVESCGSRVPSLSLFPPGDDIDYALADGVLDWLDAIGMTLFPWQQDVLRRALGRRGPKWAAYEVDLIVPRQNGKNEILIALELAAVSLLGVRLVVHSAHEALTAAKHFNRFREFAFDDSPSYRPEIAKLFPNTKTRGFYTANGKEHIQFANGATIDFRTRTKQAGRGFSAELVVLDEAFNLPPKSVGSLQYTLRAKRNPQFWKTSSAAHAGSVVLQADRKRALEPDPADTRFLYMEWGNEQGCDPSSPETWLRSNPSVGHEAPGFGLELQTFRNEYASARHDEALLEEFVREVCGVPDPPVGSDMNHPVDLDLWPTLKAATSHPEANKTWALAVSPDRRWASIGKSGHNSEGKPHVEWMHHRAGTGWIVETIAAEFAEHRTPIRIHKSGPEGSFIAPLRAAGVDVVEVSSSEVAQATGQLIDAANSGQLAHLGQPSLDKALNGAEVRTSSDGAMLWSQRNSSVEITPLIAVTVALGGVPVLEPVYAGNYFYDLDELEDDE